MRRSAAVLCCLLLCAAAPAAHAGTTALTKTTYDAIQAAQAQLDAGKAGAAAVALRALLGTLDALPYDQAMVLQTLAQAEMARDAPGAAADHLERALALDVLDGAARLNARYNLAQVAMAAERYEDAIEHVSAWLAETPTPRAEAHALLGSAHLQLRHFRAAIAPLQKAIAIAERPQESWYQALLGALYEDKAYDRCAELLYRMLRLFPNRDGYWRQLVAIQLTRERYRDALAVMELAYLRGALSSTQDLVTLAQLRAQLDAPYKAAELMETEIAAGRIPGTAAHWEFTANAWYQAREGGRSLAALRRAVDRGRAGPALQLRLAQLYVESAEWASATTLLRRLLASSSLPADDRGRGWLLLGIARHGGGAIDEARDAFVEARKSAPFRGDAEQWLAYLDATG